MMNPLMVRRLRMAGEMNFAPTLMVTPTEDEIQRGRKPLRMRRLMVMAETFEGEAVEGGEGV
jgi:hypothetical protein